MIVVALTLAITMPTSGMSQTSQSSDVEDLLQACAADPNDAATYADAGKTLNLGYCVGIIAGVKDITAANCWALRAGEGGSKSLSADTLGVSRNAAIQAFKNWAEANPQQWNVYASLGVMTAMRETFPCN